MERRKLGSRGPGISAIGFGAAEAGGDIFGPNESEREVIQAIDAAIDAGVTLIDTAEVYGNGRSEELVGKAVRHKRGSVFIATKVAPRLWRFGTGLRPEEIQRAVRRSLERLRTNHIDLYQLHARDAAVPIEDSWGAMASLVDEGLVRYIGVSNLGHEEIERCERIRHVDSVQNELSLVQMDDCAEMLPWLDEQGIGYLAYAPLGYGILSGGITAQSVFQMSDWRSGSGYGLSTYQKLFAPGARNQWLARVDKMRPIAERLRTSVATLALCWVLQQRGVTAVIAGSRNPRHVRSNAKAAELKPPYEEVGEIGQIFLH